MKRKRDGDNEGPERKKIKFQSFLESIPSNEKIYSLAIEQYVPESETTKYFDLAKSLKCDSESSVIKNLKEMIFRFQNKTTSCSEILAYKLIEVFSNKEKRETILRIIHKLMKTKGFSRDIFLNRLMNSDPASQIQIQIDKTELFLEFENFKIYPIEEYLKNCSFLTLYSMIIKNLYDNALLSRLFQSIVSIHGEKFLVFFLSKILKENCWSIDRVTPKLVKHYGDELIFSLIFSSNSSFYEDEYDRNIMKYYNPREILPPTRTLSTFCLRFMSVANLEVFVSDSLSKGIIWPLLIHTIKSYNHIISLRKKILKKIKSLLSLEEFDKQLVMILFILFKTSFSKSSEFHQKFLKFLIYVLKDGSRAISEFISVLHPCVDKYEKNVKMLNNYLNIGRKLDSENRENSNIMGFINMVKMKLNESGESTDRLNITRQRSMISKAFAKSSEDEEEDGIRLHNFLERSLQQSQPQAIFEKLMEFENLYPRWYVNKFLPELLKRYPPTFKYFSKIEELRRILRSRNKIPLFSENPELLNRNGFFGSSPEYIAHEDIVFSVLDQIYKFRDSERHRIREFKKIRKFLKNKKDEFKFPKTTKVLLTKKIFSMSILIIANHNFGNLKSPNRLRKSWWFRDDFIPCFYMDLFLHYDSLRSFFMSPFVENTNINQVVETENYYFSSSLLFSYILDTPNIETKKPSEIIESTIESLYPSNDFQFYLYFRFFFVLYNNTNETKLPESVINKLILFVTKHNFYKRRENKNLNNISTTRKFENLGIIKFQKSLTIEFSHFLQFSISHNHQHSEFEEYLKCVIRKFFDKRDMERIFEEYLLQLLLSENQNKTHIHRVRTVLLQFFFERNRKLKILFIFSLLRDNLNPQRLEILFSECLELLSLKVFESKTEESEKNEIFRRLKGLDFIFPFSPVVMNFYGKLQKVVGFPEKSFYFDIHVFLVSIFRYLWFREKTNDSEETTVKDCLFNISPKLIDYLSDFKRFLKTSIFTDNEKILGEKELSFLRKQYFQKAPIVCASIIGYTSRFLFCESGSKDIEQKMNFLIPQINVKSENERKFLSKLFENYVKSLVTIRLRLLTYGKYDVTVYGSNQSKLISESKWNTKIIAFILKKEPLMIKELENVDCNSCYVKSKNLELLISLVIFRIILDYFTIDWVENIAKVGCEKVLIKYFEVLKKRYFASKTQTPEKINIHNIFQNHFREEAITVFENIRVFFRSSPIVRQLL